MPIFWTSYQDLGTVAYVFLVNSLVFIPILTLYNEILFAVFGICIQPSLINQALLSKKTQVAVNPFHQESVDE